MNVPTFSLQVRIKFWISDVCWLCNSAAANAKREETRKRRLKEIFDSKAIINCVYKQRVIRSPIFVILKLPIRTFLKTSYYDYTKGPSINYVITFLAIFDPPPPTIINHHHSQTPLLILHHHFSNFDLPLPLLTFKVFMNIHFLFCRVQTFEYLVMIFIYKLNSSSNT